ncbi:hypothetical protein ACERZ8_02685 [Tateyamaria armeniaca]|uniref:Uncharacterized protein n=1 Tax=Tateyamaria armeniaca TaxID=2518930 RepID=A0ABW8UPM4_9RHOB
MDDDQLKIVVKAFRRQIVGIFGLLFVGIAGALFLIYSDIRADIASNSGDLAEIRAIASDNSASILAAITEVRANGSKIVTNTGLINSDKRERTSISEVLFRVSEDVGRIDGRLGMLPERIEELDELKLQVANSEERLEDAFLAAIEAVATIDNLAAGLNAACEDAAILRAERISSLYSDDETRQLLQRARPSAKNREIFFKNRSNFFVSVSCGNVYFLFEDEQDVVDPILINAISDVARNISPIYLFEHDDRNSIGSELLWRF